MLRLKHSYFWDLILSNKSLLDSLDSVLRFFPRPYDGAATKHAIFTNVSALQVYHRTFLIFLRLSKHRETDHESLDLPHWAETLYRDRVFDIAKLLDICALYGATNMDVVSELVGHVCSAQSRYYEDWGRACDRLIGAISEVILSLQRKVCVHLLIPVFLYHGLRCVWCSGGFCWVDTATVQSKTSELDQILFAFDATASLALALRAHSPLTHQLVSPSAVRALASLYDIAVQRADDGCVYCCASLL